MDFWDRMKDALGKGLETSRDLLNRAGDKAQDLGQKGVVRFEIMQLERQAEQLVTKLGSATFEHLEINGATSISKKNNDIADLIREISDVRERIRGKEFELKNAGGEE